MLKFEMGSIKFLIFFFVLLIKTSLLQAKILVGPTLIFETIQRTIPETIQTLKYAYGIGLTKDTFLNTLFFDLGIAYSNSFDGFSSGNSLEEKQGWLQLGFLTNFYQRDPLYLSLKFGTAYLYTHDAYHDATKQINQIDRITYWRPYLGLEGAVLAHSGFNVRESILFPYDQFQRRWAIQFILQLVL